MPLFRAKSASFSARWQADNEDWLANNFDKIIGTQDVHTSEGDVAKIEEHILRCLAAALAAVLRRQGYCLHLCAHKGR